MVKYGPKDFEIYIANATASFDPTAKGNDKSLALYYDAAVTAGTVLTNFVKLADTNSVSIDPVEDSTNTKTYLGSTSTGAQNSDVYVTEEPEVDITINADPAFLEQLTPYMLETQTDTHSDYTNYAYFNLGSKATSEVAFLIRIYKKVGTNYYYKNYIITNPAFKKVDNVDISGDDEVNSAEYSIAGVKALTDKDFYFGTTKETVANLDN